MTGKDVLKIKMGKNDAGAKTIGEYLVALAAAVWEENEGFSGKRPFGASGWECEIYLALIQAKAIPGSLDEDDYIDECDEQAADALVKKALKSLRGLISS